MKQPVGKRLIAPSGQRGELTVHDEGPRMRGGAPSMHGGANVEVDVTANGVQFALVHDAAYRVLTTQGKVCDLARWGARELVFVLHPRRRLDGTRRALSLAAVESIAVIAPARRGVPLAIGGERFVPVAQWTTDAVGERAA